jgi:glycosyltransferase involved in cell wall biosynthesis
MSDPHLSVIVCTYNRPLALRAVLSSLRNQSRSDFEVIVADDGSGPPTKAVIDEIMPAFGGRLRHVWQEDKGFRVAAARNRAAEAARAPYLAFLDGDCVPRTDYAHAYMKQRRPDLILRGSRVLCSEALTRRIESGELQNPHRLGMNALRALHRDRDINRFGALRRGFLDRLRVMSSVARPRNWRLLRGCNFVVPTEAYFAVGGCDEIYEGWGYEDSDLCIRLMNFGLRIHRGTADTCVLHLWHRENDRRFEGDNLRRLEQTRRSGAILPAQGMRSEPNPA